MTKNYLCTGITLAFAIIMAACGNTSQKGEEVGERQIFDYLPTSSATTTSTGTSTAPPPVPSCPLDKPYYNAFGDTCFNDGVQFCQFNLNCTDPSMPFCYHGICSDVDPTKKDPCTDPAASASFNGECYDPWFDSSSCGGYTHVCGAGTICQQGFCVDGSVTCPQEAPHAFNGKCYNLFSDSENCGVVGQACPAFKPTCYLARCYDQIPGKLTQSGTINWPELERKLAQAKLDKAYL